MRISIEQYVAVENPKAASQFLTKYGVPQATSLKDLADKMEVVTYKYRELALADLANIDTPYRRLIMDSVNTEVAVATLIPENVSNCDGGCGCKNKKEENPKAYQFLELLSLINHRKISYFYIEKIYSLIKNIDDEII